MGVAASGTDKYGGVQKDAGMYGRRSYGGSRAATAEEYARADDHAKQWDERYTRQMGPSIDYTQANQDRARGRQARSEQLYGQQLAAEQARGGGPSAATAQNAVDLDAMALQQAQQGAQGGMRGAQMQGTQAMGQAGAQYGRARAGETAAGRGAFIGGAGELRRDDLGQAGMDLGRQNALAEMAARQRALADQQNAFYEKLGFGARTANMDAEHAGNELALQEYAQMGGAAAAAEDATAAAIARAGQATAAAAGAASDRRLKKDVSKLKYGGR